MYAPLQPILFEDWLAKGGEYVQTQTPFHIPLKKALLPHVQHIISQVNLGNSAIPLMQAMRSLLAGNFFTLDHGAKFLAFLRLGSILMRLIYLISIWMDGIKAIVHEHVEVVRRFDKERLIEAIQHSACKLFVVV